MTTEAQETQTPQERLGAAFEAFGQVNKTLPAGLPPFQIPPFLETAASTDAVVRLLLDKGIVDEEEFVDAKTLRMAEMVEELSEGARKLKRQVTGLVIAGANPTV